MRMDWEIDGKKGTIVFPEGEVVYQQPKGRIVIEPIYQSGQSITPNYKRYILTNQVNSKEQDGREFTTFNNMQVLVKSTNPNDELQEVTTNPFNGYCYRQDGR